MTKTEYVIGAAGASLNDAAWAANAGAVRAGLAGELKTGRLLAEAAREMQGPVVFNDVRIPLKGVSANVDHLILSGKTLTLIDTKVWAPGIYWTLNGHSYRGLKPFVHAEKKTMEMARNGLTRYLGSKGMSVEFAETLIVVWPSRRPMLNSLALLKSPAARIISGTALSRQLPRFLGEADADPKLVDLVAPLVRSHATTS